MSAAPASICEQLSECHQQSALFPVGVSFILSLWHAERLDIFCHCFVSERCDTRSGILAFSSKLLVSVSCTARQNGPKRS